jgi:UDP-2,4-diacetamido-2,4,6-trideoxy-beta-L-altropyranose hydrolase
MHRHKAFAKLGESAHMTGILFQVDANTHIGMGHLKRCLSLAQAIQQLGSECSFLTTRNDFVQRHLSILGIPHQWAEQADIDAAEVKQVRTFADKQGAGVVVVDSYAARQDYLTALRDAGLCVVAIDDLALFPFPCQLVVNGGAQARQLPYTSSSGDTRFLLGTKYALLSPEYWRGNKRSLQKTVREILITMGGSDAHGLTSRLLKALDELQGKFAVTAIVGPLYQNPAEVGGVAKHCHRPSRIIVNPKSIRSSLLCADIAISAGGQTLYELAATGTPTVAIQVADNQRDSLCALTVKGVNVAAGSAADPQLIEKVKSSVTKLMSDYETRSRMSRSGQRLVDGKGALRTAKVILSRKRKITSQAWK